jgi:hypothetical protein
MEHNSDVRLSAALLLGEIQTLAYMVNAFTEYCVFVRFSGHVDQIEVDVARTKSDYLDKVVNGQTYLSQDSSDEKNMIRLRKIKTELRKILRKNKVDYSRLNYEVEEVRHYKLV